MTRITGGMTANAEVVRFANNVRVPASLWSRERSTSIVGTSRRRIVPGPKATPCPFSEDFPQAARRRTARVQEVQRDRLALAILVTEKCQTGSGIFPDSAQVTPRRKIGRHRRRSRCRFSRTIRREPSDRLHPTGMSFFHEIGSMNLSYYTSASPLRSLLVYPLS
jgi:hypothetical protein